MAKPKSNGKKDPENLKETEPVDETSGDGNTSASSEPKRTFGPHSWDNAYRSQETVNNLKPLFEAGDNPLDLLMRSILAGLHTEEYVLVVALCEELSKCREVSDTIGEQEVRDILAMLPSTKGQAREQLVRAITGGYFGEKGKSEGDTLTAKLKRAALG